jgi:hypothetical protein
MKFHLMETVNGLNVTVYEVQVSYFMLYYGVYWSWYNLKCVNNARNIK